MFWTAATLMLIAAGLVTAWPLLSGGSHWKAVGLAVLLVMPLGGSLLYREVGEPLAMNAPHPSTGGQTGGQDMTALTESLRANLTEREEDLEGWLLLGRSLKSLQRFDEALDALQTAARIAPGNPLVSVELAEAMLFASGNPQVTPEIRGMLLGAVEQDPGLQKGLWLLGIDAMQRGDDASAIGYWERLLAQVEPGTPIAQSVQDQITQARQRQGVEAPVAAPEVDDGQWPGLAIEVSLGEAAGSVGAPGGLPATAVLFVIARPAGVSVGPPLGVARIERPVFPVTLTLDDRNAMIEQNQLSTQAALSIQARLSMSGSVMASPGDWSSDAVDISTDQPGPHAISLVNPVE